MLVLRRRAGEAILVGNDVEIEVIEISRSRVKLGVRAPCHVSVVRKETLTVSRENRLASDLIANHDGVGELLQLLNQPALSSNSRNRNGVNRNGVNQGASNRNGPADGSAE